MQIPLLLPLRQDATFENFFAGANEQLKEYLMQTLMDPSNTLIYLWGDKSSGKSHLLQACCHYAFLHERTSIYLPLSKRNEFAPEMLEGMEHTDVVCIDDLDAIEGNRDWEEAIFHFYNRTLSLSTKVIFAANVPPAKLNLSLPDLRTRLTAITIFQLASLADSDKRQVLQLYANTKGLKLPDSVADFLLNRQTRDMSGLIELIDKLDHASLAAQRKLTIPFVKTVL